MKPENIKNIQIIGIDLGTSFIIIAWVDETGTSRTVVINGSNMTRAATYIPSDLDEPITGEEALNMVLVEPNNVFTYVKRHVGTDKVLATIGGEKITAQFVQTLQLKFIYQEVQRYFGEDITEFFAVVTVPAGANEAFRQSVKQSAEDAGFSILAIINEPTSAAIDYGIKDNEGDRLIVVADFGGGTADFTIGAMQGGQLNVLGSFGDNNLGGRDVNDTMMNLAKKRFKSEYGIEFTLEKYPQEYWKLEEVIEQQKKLLSSKSKVRFLASAEGKTLDITLTREDLASMLAPIIERIDKLMKNALKEASVELTDVDHVLYVGGSTRLKAFRDWAEGLFGKDKIFESKVVPDLTVAHGAAIYAVQLASQEKGPVVSENNKAIPIPEVVHEDVTSNPLGIAVVDHETRNGLKNSTVLDRNTPIPANSMSQFSSISDTQTHFHVQVLQGEDHAPLKDCLIVGEARLKLPARPTTVDSLEVTMSYNRSGMVTVTVFDTVSKHSEDITVNFNTKAKAC